MVRRLAISLIGTVLLLGGAPPPAAAHAAVVKSTPAANATVAGPDVAVDIQFSERVDHERSRLTLATPDDKFIPLDIGADDAPDHLKATAKGLAAGAYRLRWNVLSDDGHITHGEIPFTVGP